MAASNTAHKKKKASSSSASYRNVPVATRGITDKKLKGKLKYSERIVRQAQENAAKVNDWLLPETAGSLEAEGLEETWRYKQSDILTAAPAGVKHRVFDMSLPDRTPYV